MHVCLAQQLLSLFYSKSKGFILRSQNSSLPISNLINFLQLNLLEL